MSRWDHEPCTGVMAAVGAAISAAPADHGVLVSATTGQPMALVPVALPRCRHCGEGLPAAVTATLSYCSRCGTFRRRAR